MRIPIEIGKLKNGDILYDRENKAWEFIGFSRWDPNFFILIKQDRIEGMSFGRDLDDGVRIVHIRDESQYSKDHAYLDVARNRETNVADWVN